MTATNRPGDGASLQVPTSWRVFTTHRTPAPLCGCCDKPMVQTSPNQWHCPGYVEQMKNKNVNFGDEQDS